MTSLAQQKLYFRSCRSQHSPGYVWPPVSLKCCSTLLCSYRATMSRAGSPVSFRCSGLFSWLDIKVFSVAERWNWSFSLDRKVSPLARATSCKGSEGKRTLQTYKNVEKKKNVLHITVSNTDFKVGIPQPRLPKSQTEPEGLRLLIACGGQQLQFRNVSQDPDVQMLSLRWTPNLVAALVWFCVPWQRPTLGSGCSECTSSWSWRLWTSPCCSHDPVPSSFAPRVKASSSSQTRDWLLTYTTYPGSPGMDRPDDSQNLKQHYVVFKFIFTEPWLVTRRMEPLAQLARSIIKMCLKLSFKGGRATQSCCCYFLKNTEKMCGGCFLLPSLIC